MSVLGENATIKATNDEGALTFKFKSDILDVKPGWNATVTCVTKVGVNDQTANDFEFYLNPSKGLFIVKGSDINSIAITGTSGKLVYNNTTSNNNKIDLSHLNNGIYFIHVTTKDNTVQTHKISIVK
ncbi:MAG: T9SS type A sorting domain-containing protein [Salinivirgaceae bacterium]|nr:T9SS type A sorting domain-containing protein [Salinivirgaceae bacterium]